MLSPSIERSVDRGCSLGENVLVLYWPLVFYMSHMTLFALIIFVLVLCDEPNQYLIGLLIHVSVGVTIVFAVGVGITLYRTTCLSHGRSDISRRIW